MAYYIWRYYSFGIFLIWLFVAYIFFGLDVVLYYFTGLSITGLRGLEGIVAGFKMLAILLVVVPVAVALSLPWLFIVFSGREPKGPHQQPTDA
jgi:hypothetical protein